MSDINIGGGESDNNIRLDRYVLMPASADRRESLMRRSNRVSGGAGTRSPIEERQGWAGGEIFVIGPSGTSYVPTSSGAGAISLSSSASRSHGSGQQDRSARPY